jgi:hypothetical protein
VPGLILAAVNPDNTPAGYNWTFAFPILLFCVVALILYALFSRPHRRVPARAISATQAGSRPLDANAARAAAVAGGMSEPTVAETTATVPAAAAPPASEPGGAHLTGSVDSADSGATPPEDGKSEPGTGASE